MHNLSGKVAFITGGASGIGLAMARAFGAEGMAVMLADIEREALDRAVEDLRSRQIRAEGVVADVGRREALRAAADEAIAKFGKVHLVCNNAGVAAGGVVGAVAERDWNWVVDVNLMGVVHGVEIFTPLMEGHGEGGHFVNTASIAGMLSPPGLEPYSASKFAVVAMSEGWAVQLSGRGIGVSILCPGFVKTRIHESRRNRPDTYGHADPDAGGEGMSAAVLGGIDVEPVAARAVEGVKADELYIFTHPEFKAPIAARFERILAAFDAAAGSRALLGLGDRALPSVDLGATPAPS